MASTSPAADSPRMKLDGRQSVLMLAALLACAHMELAHALPLGADNMAPEEFARFSRGSVEGSKALHGAREDLRQAAVKLHQGRQDEAFALLKAARKKHETLPPARLMLARLYFSRGELTRARAELERAAAESPRYPGLYVTLAELAIVENRDTDGLVQLEKARSLLEAGELPADQREATRLRIHLNAGVLTARRGDWPAAQGHLSSYLEVQPKDGRVRQQLAQAFFEQGNLTAAYRELKRAAADQPSLEPPPVSMGWMYAQKGNVQQARHWMEQALKEDPRNARVQRAVGTWYFRQGKIERAMNHAQLAAKLDPVAKDVQLLLGLVARAVKDFPKAESVFEALQRESPGDVSAANQLALVLAEQANKAKRQRALQMAETNARLYPSSVEALATLGWVYYRSGRTEEAERALRAAVSRGSRTPDSLYYLARVICEKGQRAEAKKLVEEALVAHGTFLFRKEAQEWLMHADFGGRGPARITHGR